MTALEDPVRARAGLLLTMAPVAEAIAREPPHVTA
jgi:hypothetical protein